MGVENKADPGKWSAHPLTQATILPLCHSKADAYSGSLAGVLLHRHLIRFVGRSKKGSTLHTNGRANCRSCVRFVGDLKSRLSGRQTGFISHRTALSPKTFHTHIEIVASKGRYMRLGLVCSLLFAVCTWLATSCKMNCPSRSKDLPPED